MIDLLTYEFLKRYVEGSQMGECAKPRGVWKDYADTKVEVEYTTGDYITYNNTVYILPYTSEGKEQTISNNTAAHPNYKPDYIAEDGTNASIWQRIATVSASEIITEVKASIQDDANAAVEIAISNIWNEGV